MKHVFRILALVFLTITVTACGTPPAAPAILTVAPVVDTLEEQTGIAEVAPTTDEAAQADAELRIALQQTLDLWSKAYQEQDPKILRQAIDPQNYKLRSDLTQQLQYTTRAESALEGIPTPPISRTWTAKLQAFAERPNGYVVAQAEVDGTNRTFILKDIQGQWLLAAPKEEDLGAVLEIDDTQFIISHYAWDKDVVARVREALQAVHADVSAQLGAGPTEAVKVQLVPLRSLVPPTTTRGSNFRYIGSDGTRYRPDKKDLVVISPNSWDFPNYGLGSDWEAQLAAILEYEYVNLINDCCFAPIEKQKFWMTNGLTGYATLDSQTTIYSETIRTALANNTLLPIRAPDVQGDAVASDLHSRSQFYQDFETVQLVQAEAVMLVEYLVRQHGGFTGYRKLIADYATSQNIAESVQRVLGISVGELDQQWQADLQQRFGT